MSRSSPDAVLGVLTKAADLIRDKKRWTQGSMAVDERGRDVSPCAPDAMRWCAGGAVDHAALEDSRYDRDLVLGCIKQLEISITAVRGYESVTSYNDNHGHAAMIKVFDSAIARMRALSPKYQAARKGWETRRRRMAEQAAPVFGGTIIEAPAAEPTKITV